MTANDRRRVTTFLALLVLICVNVGCSSPERTSGSNSALVDPAKYELDLLRCSVETDEEYDQEASEPSIGGDTVRSVVAEYRLTNLDAVRRRFDLRVTRTDSNGVEIRFIAKDSARLDPGESSVEQVRKRVVPDDVAPYACTAEVWDSVIDDAFPDD